MPRKLSRRPYLSPGMPASIDPTTVPHSAAETVNPFSHGERLYAAVSPLVVPEMTTVSNPNSNPPKAATIVLFARYPFNFNGPPTSQTCFYRRDRRGRRGINFLAFSTISACSAVKCFLFSLAGMPFLKRPSIAPAAWLPSNLVSQPSPPANSAPRFRIQMLSEPVLMARDESRQNRAASNLSTIHSTRNLAATCSSELH